MYTNVSSALASKIMENSRICAARLEFDAATLESGFKSINLKQQANSGTETLEIGGCVAAQVEVEMEKPDNTITAHEFTLSFGIQLDDESVEYVPMGIFTAQKPTETYDGIIRFTAYDRMYYKLKYGYFTEITSFPVDGKVILQEIAGMAGVTLGNLDELPDGVMIGWRTESTETDDGSQTTENVAPFSGYTYQEAAGYLAQAYGRFATFNRDGELEFRWYEDASYTISTSRLGTDAECAECEYELQTIECTAGDETFSAGDGTVGISVDNPIMTQELLNNVWELIGGMAYTPTTASFLGDPRLDLGDIISIAKMDGTTVDVPLMSITQSFDGGLSTEIGSYGDTEEMESTGSGGSVSSALSRLAAELLLAQEAILSKVSTKYLEANYANITTLESDYVKASYLTANYITATDIESKYVTTTYLITNYLTAESIEAKYATITTLEASYATITSLDAVNATVKTLSADLANVNTILSGTVGTGSLATIRLTASNVVIDEAVIQDAAIKSLSASKLTAGTIYTSLVTIQSAEDDKSLYITDKLIAMYDTSNTQRLQAGMTSETEGYNFVIWDADGTELFNATGVTASGIPSETIVNDHVASNAAISGSKLDIASVATALNEDGSLTIDYGKVMINGSTLSAWYTTVNEKVDGLTTTTSTLETSLEVVQGNIALLASATELKTLEDTGTTLYEQYTAIVADIDSITQTVNATSTILYGDDDTTGLADLVNDSATTIEDLVAVLSDEDGNYISVESLQSKIEQFSDEVAITISSSLAAYEATQEGILTTLDEYATYFSFTTDGLRISDSDSDFALLLSSDRVSFLESDSEVAYISDSMLYIYDADILNSLQLGNFKWMPRESGNLSLVKVGDS